MPELPDVVVFKRYLDATAMHQRIANVDVLDRDLLDGVSSKTLRSHLEGTEFGSTSTHGKNLFVHFEGNEEWLLLHFGMTGFLKYFKDDDDAPPHTRVRFDFDSGYHLAYDCQRKLGKVRLTDDRRALIEDLRLGPDVLSDDLDFNRFSDILDERKAAVKSTLMNQRLLAGIGNVYSDEILFQAHIHPETKVVDLDNDAEHLLFRTMRRVLETAIERNADPEEFPHSWLLPHVDGDCPRCNSTIETTRVAGRTAHFCPQCQARP